MWSAMEFEEAIRRYRRKLVEDDKVFRLWPPPPSPRLSHCDRKNTWYLRDDQGKLIARVNESGVYLP